ncbi:unnamed protein product [Pleuronectes platessa]|uniref:Uncharacterized protein n=1 Tax=Pleuronectes platessa TaxID=8262 RepID=A0A9N7YHS9_PLEPL|nr:unnamed protein product [Pleuronectes platessa]
MLTSRDIIMTQKVTRGNSLTLDDLDDLQRPGGAAGHGLHLKTFQFFSELPAKKTLQEKKTSSSEQRQAVVSLHINPCWSRVQQRVRPTQASTSSDLCLLHTSQFETPSAHINICPSLLERGDEVQEEVI